MTMSSKQILERAQLVFSPGQAMSSAEALPFAIGGDGARLRDLDGREYVDLDGAMGASILGHGHPVVHAALSAAVAAGQIGPGACLPKLELAELICGAFSSVETLSFTDSGVGALTTAVEIARVVTGKRGVVCFDACGHVDRLLAPAESRGSTQASSVSVLAFNAMDTIQELVETRADEIACVVAQPVATEFGLLAPREGFLELLRELTEEYGVLLVFDEVVTGFRLCWGGAQTLYGVEPDLTCLGGVIGGGLLIGAVGGRRTMLEVLGSQGGATSPNPASAGSALAAAAGLAVLSQLRGDGAYAELEARTSRLESGLKAAVERSEHSVGIHALGSLLSVFFGRDEVYDLADIKKADSQLYGRFAAALREQGVLVPRAPGGPWYVPTTLSDADLDAVLFAADRALASL